jgi:hypothetical protein
MLRVSCSEAIHLRAPPLGTANLSPYPAQHMPKVGLVVDKTKIFVFDCPVYVVVRIPLSRLFLININNLSLNVELQWHWVLQYICPPNDVHDLALF